MATTGPAAEVAARTTRNIIVVGASAGGVSPRVIGVILTGNLDCGMAGLLSIKARGGLALVQDPAEAKARSMPESTIAKVAADHVVSLQALAL